MRIGLSSCVLMLAVAMRLVGQEAAQPGPVQPSETQPTQPLPVQPQPADTGSVTGHVYLGDTHLPARIAAVTLLRAARPDTSTDETKSWTCPTDARTCPPPQGGDVQVATGLDGSFEIRGVVPGNYYVLAEKAGYISPIHLSSVGAGDLSKEEQDSLGTLFTATTVVANRATNVEISLAKGAVISGRIRFDDGERDSEAFASLLHKDTSGKWVPYQIETYGLFEENGTRTDDRGDFRITGLPEGEYLLKTSLEDWGKNYSIDIYYGDKTRLKDAKSIKVKDGEESDGDDIEIPLAKLHSVSGTVISATTGETVKAAHVELHETDDDSLVADTATSGDDDEFHFPYVPEGEYTLKVRRVADALLMDGAAPLPKPTREYEDASQAIVVRGEMSGVTVQVKPKAVGAAAQ